MLDAYRVIDLSDERGLLCGAILADLGAEVIRVEPPHGSSARRSLASGAVWEAWARNSSSVAIDLTSHAGRQRLRQLLESADFLVESFTPGVMATYGLAYEDIASTFPSLVYVSVSPFGQTGPRARDPATDLTVQAASGMMAAVGAADRPPLRLIGMQSWAHAGAEAACGALIAHHERRHSGLGQNVDVSAQEAVSLAAAFQYLSELFGDDPPKRSGGAIVSGRIEVPTVFRAQDGFVTAPFFFGPGQGPFARRLMEWICDSGECDVGTRDKDWVNYLELLEAGSEPLAELDRVVQLISSFFRVRPVAQLFDEARIRGVQLVPVNSLDEVVNDSHLSARGFWWMADDLPGSPLVPGAFARFSSTPLAYRNRAPLVDQHAFSVSAPASRGERPTESENRPRESDPIALGDVRVLDFTWLAAGPWATRLLADFGATVVKVESSARIDAMRVLPPFIDGQHDLDAGGGFQSSAAGKLSLDLDLKNPAAREIVLDLVRWADVLTESFSPRAMPALGLDYETLKGVKPDLIMVSSSLFGQDGPYASLPGVGFMGAALGGFTHATGWADRDPIGPSGPYTDYVSPKLAVAAILAALDYRDRTGQGQWIDISQLESSLAFLGPELVDYVLTGAIAGRLGNRHPSMAPHGVYRANGVDRWIAIACRDDTDWVAVCRVMSRPDLAADDELSSLEGRQARAELLDRELTRWTAGRDAIAAERILVRAGVPAAAVVDYRTVANEPQFRHREHILSVPHSRHGSISVESTHLRLHRTPARVLRGGPVLGEDTDSVLRQILRYDDARVAQLVRAGAVRRIRTYY